MSNATTPQHQAHLGGDRAGSPPRRWTPRRVSLLVLGILTVLVGVGMLTGGVVLKAVDHHWRDGAYLTTDTTTLGTAGHALAVQDIDLDGLGGGWLGEARVRATSADADARLFIGVARTDEVASYLRGVRYSTVVEIDDPDTRYVTHTGGAPSTEPAASDVWVAQVSGAGTQTLRWTPKSGGWTVVFMNGDGSSDVRITADVGATAPVVERATWALLIVGAVLTLAGAVLILVLFRRPPQTDARPATAT